MQLILVNLLNLQQIIKIKSSTKKFSTHCHSKTTSTLSKSITFSLFFLNLSVHNSSKS
ncbi:hypothetical protein Hanom_Chr15g01361061 [Helianthus anomalus]